MSWELSAAGQCQTGTLTNAARYNRRRQNGNQSRAMSTATRKPKIALILGSGFSRESGLPTTAALNKDLLRVPVGHHVDAALEREISTILSEFWRDVFGWKGRGRKPTLEDHFTVIDLAANTGHHLGPHYWPRKMRAIWRMSIHRTFQILDARFKRSHAVDRLYQELLDRYELSIITLNWDIVAEKYA